jgi:hypothetical protein
MWQFLFNPSEMELEAGPEFKNAETWAVSDKANSGQPLHWAYNKNAQLKFNSILLNGYIFGRKVEELEQGLIELFMARDGDGQAGPHVLEFIWGKRKFGPCVIKNINVKEKMWDEGQVVNAELSFTLEQIPEWTINDGAYVDVARPGRQPLREEVAPNLQAGAAGDAGATGAGETPAATPPEPTPGAGQSSNQKPANQPKTPTPNNFFPQSECDAGRRTLQNFRRLEGKFQTGLGGFFFGVNDSRVVQAVNEFVGVYSSFAGVLDTLPLDPACKKKCSYIGQAADNNRDFSCVRDCSGQASRLLNQRYNTGKCLANTLMRPS